MTIFTSDEAYEFDRTHMEAKETGKGRVLKCPWCPHANGCESSCSHLIGSGDPMEGMYWGGNIDFIEKAISQLHEISEIIDGRFDFQAFFKDVPNWKHIRLPIKEVEEEIIWEENNGSVCYQAIIGHPAIKQHSYTEWNGGFTSGSTTYFFLIPEQRQSFLKEVETIRRRLEKPRIVHLGDDLFYEKYERYEISEDRKYEVRSLCRSRGRNCLLPSVRAYRDYPGLLVQTPNLVACPKCLEKWKPLRALNVLGGNP